MGRPVLFYCLSMISCNRLRNSSRLSHSLASISSSECALIFWLAESGNVLLSQPGNRNSRAVRSFAIPAFISLNRPQGALDFGSKYNVARSLETTGEQERCRWNEKRTHPVRGESFFHGIRQRPTLPGRLQPSTIGAERLNFCVRYGNRWIPFAIVTGKL